MAVLSVATARQRIAAVLEALPGWHESRWGYDIFPLDPGQYAHLSFAVGVPDTVPADAIQFVARKCGLNGGVANSSIAIRWTYRLRADRQVADYDAALAAEAAALIAIGTAVSTDVHYMPEELRREVVGDGTWLLGQIRVRATHHMALV